MTDGYSPATLDDVIRAFRRTQLAALFALLVMTGSVPVSIAALVHVADDAACEPLFVSHDESAHRIGAARTLSTLPQHCAVCHWLQSFQTTVSSSPIAVHTTDVARLSISSLPIALVHAVVDVPARAPPALLNS